jgi:hypothetical protein
LPERPNVYLLHQFRNKQCNAAQPAGTSAFGWKAGNQQDTWAGQVSGLTAIITNIADAAIAIKTINEQGEGKAHDPVPQKPFTGSQFPIEAAYQLNNDSNDTSTYKTIWSTGAALDFVTMPKLAPDATACWAAGVIPNWG